MALEDAGYHVLGPIARGGMAEVVLAERIGPGGVRKRLAIKRLLPDLASEPELVSMLENEARIAVELEHPNIVSVFELGESEGELYLAMEFVRGWDLATILDACAKRGRVMPPRIALHVAREICLALAYAHAKTDERGAPLGILHRDVSPSNVLVSVEGVVKLTDFGIARAALASASTPGMWLRGKIPYVSPEQAAGQRLDARSDLYSVGVLLFEMLTATRLFSTDMASATEVRARPLPRLAELAAEAASLQPLLDRALAFEKETRFGSAQEMADAIARAATAFGPAASPAVFATFLGELALPPPVSPDNVGEGERTEVVSVGRIPLVARSSNGVAGVLVSRAPSVASAGPTAARSASTFRPQNARSPLPMAVLFAVVFGSVMLVTKTVVERSRPPARLEVRTTMPGANVWIDGVHRGTTPLVATDLVPGIHQLTVGMSDAGVTRDIDLGAVPDQTLDLDVR